MPRIETYSEFAGILAAISDLRSEVAANNLLIQQLIIKEKQMADVLDTIIANEGIESTDLTAVKALLDKATADLVALRAGTIPLNDPRFQTAIDNQTRIIAAFNAITTPAPPPTPVPTPAPAPTPAPPPTPPGPAPAV